MNPSSPETTQETSPSIISETSSSSDDDLRRSDRAPGKTRKGAEGGDRSSGQPRGKASGRKNSAASSEDVARAAPFFDAWADIAAPALGKLRAVSDKRVKAVIELIDALGPDALPLFRDAATFVSTHPKTLKFWKEGGFGFDNLINERGAKVVKHAEAFAAMTPAQGEHDTTPRRKYEDD